jgi:hypothetical protein
MANDIIYTGPIGNPGQTESACFSPLDRGDCIDLGKIIEEELEEISPGDIITYNKDVVTYINKVVINEK